MKKKTLKKKREKIRRRAKEPTELFTKNTGLCEHESGCIGADSCPVLEG